jgi:amino-acid N-acetyltransferase
VIRPATTSDAQAICELINYYAERGRMLHRSLESVYESLRDFLVCCQDGQVVGCVGLSVSWKDLGEIRSLAVAADHQGKGAGRALVMQAAQDAKALGLKRVFALTYEMKFFAALGFVVVDKESLPTKVWRDCIHCPRADACDEIAVVLDLE